jgi:hypothetical protein
MKLLSLLFVAVSCCARTPALTPMTLAEFRADLKIWLDVAEAKADIPEVPDSWIVKEGREQWTVPADWLRADLKAKNYAHIKSRLTAMIEASDFAVTKSNSDDAAAKMKAILSRREFNPPDDSWWEDMQARFWKKVGQIFKFLFGGIPKVPELSDRFFWILIAGLSAAGILLLARRLLFRPGVETDDPGAAPLSPSRRAWLDFARRAIAAQSAGDYREAVRLAYWAGVYRLEELGEWRADRTRTHREYLRMLPRESLRYAPLAAITEGFEHAWYAGEPATDVEFQTIANHLEEIGCQLRSSQTTANS